MNQKQAFTGRALSSSITNVGAGAFSNCKSLTSLTLPERIKEISAGLISGCTSLNSLVVPSRVTKIGDSAFKGSGITSMTLGNGVTEIGPYAFANCTKLSSVYLPDVITRISDGLFSGCSSLAEVEIPEDVKVIGNYSFKGTKISSMVIGNAVTNIGAHAFSDCSLLGSLVLPDDLRTIGSNACYNCKKLTSITIPSRTEEIGSSAFEGDVALTKVNITDLSRWCGISFGNATANPLYYSRHLYLNSSELTSLTIPDSVTKIGSYAFCRASSIKTVLIPASVVDIGRGAFSGCSELKAIEIPSAVSTLGDSAFEGTGLTSIVIPANVTAVGSRAFYGCTNLTSVTIESGTTVVASDAFGGCTAIRTVNVPTSLVLATLFPDAYGSLTGMTIPEGTSSINADAYKGCSTLTTVAIPASVTSIGSGAFEDCNALERVDIEDLDAWCRISLADQNANPLNVGGVAYTNGVEVGSVIVPSDVTNLGDYQFYNWRNLKSVTLAPDTETIGASTFAGSGVESIIIPSSVKTLGSRAFYGCMNLFSVIIASAETVVAVDAFSQDANIRTVSVPASFVLSTLFPNSYSLLTSITIPEGTVSIAANAYKGCAVVTGLVLPETVASIGGSAFEACSRLARINIPSSVTSIGASAFRQCDALSRIDIGDIESWCRVSLGNATANPLNGGGSAYVGEQKVTSVVMPLDVVGVGKYLFYNWKDLESVALASESRTIGVSSFESSGIESILIPVSVTAVNSRAFYGCTDIATVTMMGSPSVATDAFEGCAAIRTVNVPASYVLSVLFPDSYGLLTDVTIPAGTVSIAANAYKGCAAVESIVVPATVTTIGSSAFQDCSNLTSVKFNGQAPACGDNVFLGTSADLVVYAENGSSGWTQWNGKPLAFVEAGGGSGEEEATERIALTVTNVVIHYIVNSVVPEKTYPATYDTGFVNIITEVKSGGAVSVPATWMVNYPNYVSKFGNDFTKSLTKETGKYDGSGNPMLVWQDYVAGTDPTNPDDTFRASVIMVDGKPVISYTPELNDSEKALRSYKTYGKKSLMDKDWDEVAEGDEASYNFFKVTVEMK